MPERKFLNCILLEGIVLTAFAILILLIPKLTSVSFGVMLSAAFIICGFFKAVHTIINRNFGINMYYRIFTGLVLAVIGILLLFVPDISLVWLLAITGVYFILDGIGVMAFSSKITSMYKYTGSTFTAAILLLLTGTVIILGIPVIPLITVSLISGIAFLVKGISKIMIALINKNNYN